MTTTLDRRYGVNSGLAYKVPVTVVATSNITLSGEQTIDGISVLESNASSKPDRVLCTAQTSSVDNGIYDVSTGSWTRSVDANGNLDLVKGTQVIVTRGTYANSIWECTGTDPITIGTSAITWSQSLSASFLTTLAASGGSALVGFIQSGTGATARTAQAKMRERVTPEDFGAVGDDSTDDLAAFNLMTAAVADGGTMELTPGKVYRLSAVWTWGTTRSRLTLQMNGSTIRANHTGHGIDITGANESYTGHSILNGTIQGPNVSYPSSAPELAGTSTGAGIRMGSSSDTTNSPSAYGNQFINVTIQGFLYGRYMRAAMLCTMIGGSIRYNQYGDAWDGGQANGNVSVGVRIRENRRIGVTSIGTTGGSLTNATANKYIGCIFETNIPYRSDNPAGFSGGYPTAMDTSGTLGVGVYLYNSYDFSFSDNYYENHNYSMVIDGSSDHTTFSNERLDGGGNRIGGVKMIGAGALYTKFIACHKNCTTSTEANIEADNADHATAQFLDCAGFNLVSGSLTGVPYVRNMTLSQAGGGTVIADGNTPPQGRATDVQSGTAHGQIDTIGSATATLHCQGYQTIVCNTAVAAAGTNTTITTIDPGVQRDFVVKILNIQATRTVTIKNNSTIKTKSGADVALTASVGVITLWVAPSGTVYEV